MTIQDPTLGLIKQTQKHLRTAALYVCGDLNKAQKQTMLRQLRRARRRLEEAISELEELEPTP